MRILPFIFVAVLFCRCKEAKNPVISEKEDVKIEQPNGYKTFYREMGTADFRNFHVSLKIKYELPETLQEDTSFYDVKTFLLVYNKSAKTTDSIEMSEPSYSRLGLEILDFTDSLRFKKLLVCINWRGDSDMEMSTFIGYKDQELRELFTIYELVTIYRKDEGTLAGFERSRDELVYNFQDDYPFTISLKDYELKEKDPPIEYIGYHSESLEPIKGKVGKADYTIQAGKSLIVDTLFRTEGRVTLITADSIKVSVKLEEAKEKLRVNSAG